MSRGLSVVVALACFFVAGCEADSVDAQQERLRVMQAEPVLNDSIGDPIAVAGFTEGSLAPRRGSVRATLFEQNTAEASATAQRQTAAATTALRDSGWTVFFVACQPPLKPGDPAPPRDLVGAFPSEEWWAFAAHAYKIKDGVSYFAAVNGHGRLNGAASVDLSLRAPHSSEATSDLFPDRPAAVAIGTSCLEAASLPAQLTQTGQALELDESAVGGSSAHR